jgi:hypothetical protein
MKKNHLLYKNFINKSVNDKTYFVCNKDTYYMNIKVRLVKYKIKKQDYVLCTTLMDKKFTVEYFKNLYKERWKIETYFRYVKYCLSFNDFHSKSQKLINQEIIMHKCITSLTRLFEDIYKKYYKLKKVRLLILKII